MACKARCHGGANDHPSCGYVYIYIIYIIIVIIIFNNNNNNNNKTNNDINISNSAMWELYGIIV